MKRTFKVQKYSEIYKNMVEENKNQGFRLENIDKTGNYFLEETKQKELMSKKHKFYNSK